MTPRRWTTCWSRSTGRSASAAADGAYDKRKVYRVLEPRDGPHPDPAPAGRPDLAAWQLRPGRRWPVTRTCGTSDGSAARRGRGRSATTSGRWPRRAMFRMKTIFGDRLASRRPERQVTEGAIRCRALNIMTHQGMPDSYRVT